MSFRIKTYSIQNIEDGVTTQHLPGETLIIAAEQALSLWSSVTPISFKKLTQTGTEPDIHIRFINVHDPGILGNGSGDINIGNRYFVDFFNENMSGINWGPFDLVGVIAHEIGHMLLGTDHSLDMDAIMYQNFSEKNVKRFLGSDDVRRAQARYGVMGLGGNLKCNLNTQINISSSTSTVRVFRENNLVQVSGPANTSATIVATLPNTKATAINALNVVFATVTPNVIVNSVELFDGQTLLQKYFLSSEYYTADPNSFSQMKEWKIKLGLLKRNKIQSALVAKINIEFKALDSRFEMGDFRLTSLLAESLSEIVARAPNA